MKPRDQRDAPPLPESLGDFQIEGLLGEGGSGTVYDARWGHRRVALKVLRADLIPNERERERFFAEATLLADIEHPGVVKVLGSGVLPDERPYLVMEKLEGELLAAIVARGPLPLFDAIGIFDQLAGAVGALHERGLIHRDIKLENVILTGGHAVLLDFGIAKPENAPATTITQEGTIRGTPEYMAPERFFGAAASVATDIYELGVVLYALLCGRLPWGHAGDPAARLNPPSPSEVGAQVPAPVQTVLLRALSTRPEARPESVKELNQCVRSAAADEPEAEPRPTTDLGSAPASRQPASRQPASRSAEKRRRWPLFAIAIAVAGAVAIAALFIFAGDAREREGIDEVAATPPVPPAKDAREVAPVLVEAPPFWGADAEPPAHLADMLALHPRDTILLAGFSYRKLRESALVANAMQAKEAKDTKWLAKLESLCGGDALADLDTLMVGAAKATGDTAMDMTLTGDWSRADIERCLSLLYHHATIARHGAVTEMTSATGRLATAWQDGTMFVSTRKKANRAWMEDRLAGRDSVSENSEVTALLENVDTSAALWVVAWIPPDSMPLLFAIDTPEAFYATIRVTDDIDVYAGLRFSSAEAAKAAALIFQEKLDAFRKDPLAALWLSDAAIGVRQRDAILTAHMDGIGATATIQAIAKAVDDLEL